MDDRPIMTKYEFTRIKGIRIQQLIDGMIPFVDINEDDTYEDIFLKELKENKIPLMISRPCGFNKFQNISVSLMNSDRYH